MLKTSCNLRISTPPRGAEDWASPEHYRWGQGAHLQLIPVQPSESATGLSRTHPEYNSCLADWQKWRIIREGGDTFVQEYLKKFSKRESASDFQRRKEITPSGGFAMAAIEEIKNSIFQRMADTTRVGGSETYQQSILGKQQGVDLKGGTMNWFMGNQILPELLTMRKVGVYVDNKPKGPTLRDRGQNHPYFYVYKTENFLNWAEGERDPATGAIEYTNILLRDYQYQYDPETGLPIGNIERYRHLRLMGDGVHVQFYNTNWEKGEFLVLEIPRIPFVCFEITKSLLQDVANHQIALMNLDSSDITYILTGNVPFYTEQFDDRGNSALLKQAQEEWAANNPTDPSCETIIPSRIKEIEVGTTQGRRYPKGLERPAFISPSTEPLKASMEKQRDMKQDIRALVHLSLSNVQAKMASAESKDRDNAGLESGLSYIGLELEHGEQQLAAYWDMYENTGKIATVNYPKKWSLKSTEEVHKEVDQLKKMRDDVPSITFKREINKRIASIVVGTSVSHEALLQIEQEIKTAPGATSDPNIIEQDIKTGILSPETGIKLRCYPENELQKAEEAHARRIARIQAAQSSERVGARGNPDLSTDPEAEIAAEREGQPTRGEGQ